MSAVMQESPVMTSGALSSSGRLKLVIFDCDGVLVDSEKLSCLLVAEGAREAGIAVSDDQAVPRFAGKALSMIQLEIEAETGRPLGSGWVQQMQDRFVEVLGQGVEIIPGVHEMLDRIMALGLPVRVATNSSMAEMAAKFAVTGLGARFEVDRIHSGRDMKAPKPAPDVYLHAAALEGVDPSECVVVEDSDTGARAAVIAGMTCVLLRPHDHAGPEWAAQGGAESVKLLRIETLDAFAPLLEAALAAQHRAGGASPA